MAKIPAVVELSIHHARRRFREGKEVILVPCKLSPDAFNGAFRVSIKYNPARHANEGTPNEVFEKVRNSFIFYNCNYESGYYPHYYAPV